MRFAGTARLFVAATLLVALATGARGKALATAAAAPRTEAGYRLAVPPFRHTFPRDHAAHPSFQTEWWYYTGHLESGAERYGFELTFFRVGLDPERQHWASTWALHSLYFAHAALTDAQGRRFRFVERIGRPGAGLAGADSTRFRVWLDHWVASLDDDGRTHRLTADAGTFAFDFALVPQKPPAIHGEGGVSQKAEGAGHASHYYSLTRLALSGRLRLDGRNRDVTGLAWMDHEWMSASLGDGQKGWDWFSLQLDDGRDLMLYAMRRDDGTIDRHSGGTLIERDGRTQPLARDDFELEVLDHWTSPNTGGRYPSRWRVRVRDAGLALEVEPTLADQEFRPDGPIGIVYWEGSVRVRDLASGRPQGRGYVELTGYAGRPPSGNLPGP